MDVLFQALRWIGARAPLGRRADHFAHAYLEGHCPICHSPMQEALGDYPCPHWLIRSRRPAVRISAPFTAFGLEGVLYFLFLCIYVERGQGRATTLVQLSGDAQYLYLQLRLNQCMWRFYLPRQQAGAPRLRIDILKQRSDMVFTYEVEGVAGDAALIEALAGWTSSI